MSRTRHTENQFALDLGDDTPVNRAATESPETVDNSQLLAHPDDTEALLGQWQQAGWIRPLDTGFARLIRELSEEQGEGPQPLVLLLAALTSHQVGRGHVCIDLATLLDDAGQILALPPEEPANTGLSESEVANLQGRYPQELLSRVQLTDCLAALQGSLAVSDGSVPAPLVLNGTRLYLRRFWRYEQRIAEGIQQRLALPSPLADPQSAASQTLSTALSKLFRSTAPVDYQKLACALAARNRFAVITGGPGTGKTTTVVNLLAALQAVAGESPERAGRKYRIRLAAPTGKAAARLNESIGGAVSKLPLADLPGSVKLEDIPTKVTTLHRLLGSRPDTRQFRHHRDNPLLVDILVIDEASMVDVDLMASVFDALPASAQLILLGDKDQLASVDAGAVLGELCQRALDAHYTPDTARWLAAITGAQVPDSLVDNSGQPLDQAVAMLRKSYRFGQDSGIRQLAESVNSSELTSQVLGQIRDAGFDDVIWLNGQTPKPDPDQTLELICHHAITGSPEAFRNAGLGRVVNGEVLPTPVGYRHYLEVIHSCDLTAGSPRAAWDAHAAEVLEAFNDFQVLCALRKGPWGVEGLNQRIAQQLLAEKLIDKTEGWYAGRPVLVTGNDYNLGLMNGDIGITFNVPWDRAANGEPKQTLRVAFPSGDSTGGIRWISPSRLQQLETVYAMTVHKSQGSEFNHTCLVLPDRLSPVLTKELVYTGITRAKDWFSLITGDAQVFKDSVGQQVVRASGLALRLGEQ
ncbi:exodeoxyribonuclease V subunit alpha [Marinobacter nauticus]|uniref:RecBCD enzyme subunit RecD n=1 Tax=Marinobacter nauticus TaxID=2743 RepID=A0A368V5M4_MARNT|nr:exodeoxyribonuclease V subunit alpha [Marinobacter nauticus]RBP75607.1 DNA helicase/exodeoxyribonuclease V alpha subunit [Marinobacter nauticus]RCW36416.1 DNA helicase/exodeoxyribonuclease V alpha subunit [Marinobacter nauticus]